MKSSRKMGNGESTSWRIFMQRFSFFILIS